MEANRVSLGSGVKEQEEDRRGKGEGHRQTRRPVVGAGGGPVEGPHHAAHEDVEERVLESQGQGGLGRLLVLVLENAAVKPAHRGGNQGLDSQ